MIAAAGHTDFELHARVENLAAIAFYENAGWSVLDGVIHTVEHGISYDERILVKRAGPIAEVPDSVAVPAFRGKVAVAVAVGVGSGAFGSEDGTSAEVNGRGGGPLLV
jgi:hypothetical protein